MVDRVFPISGAVLLALVATSRLGASPDFNREVRPILSGQCFACHGPDAHERKGGLRLDTAEGAAAGGKSKKPAVAAGQRAQSEMWRRLTTADPDERMPPVETGHTLKPEQIELLGQWIDAGGQYERHWSFIPPQKAALPAGTSAHQAIDHLIAARLAAVGLTLRQQADPPTLLRRLSLDLTGLPPTLEEVSAFSPSFLTDPRAAVDQAIDRLLASPRFGEKWARMWLDLARYADSSGYGSDPLRMNIWRYRDWVIEAFNQNKSYDTFTIEQLAGDLLWENQKPEARSPELLLATAFHRNTMTNTLGGTIDEEFRVAAVKDRAETTAQVWMGLTLRCAQCHTHKFDPITNEEYYRFFAIFNQSEDKDLPDEFPTFPTPTREQQAAIDALKAEIDAAKKAMAQPTPEFLARQEEWERQTRDQENIWKTLTISQATARSGHRLAVQPDGSVTTAAPAAETDLYTLEAPAAQAGITGLRIEALPDSSLPAGGPGLSGNGNFVVSEAKIFERPNGALPPTGRFVRIELPGKQKFLHLAEVQVFSGGKNVGLAAKATQSSIDYDGVPQRALDGRTNGLFEKNSVTHTHMEDNPWWEVDLGGELPIEQIVVWNRTDLDLEKRLEGYAVKVLAADRHELFSARPAGVPSPSQAVTVDGRREVKVRMASATFEQAGFEAGKTIDGNLSAETGWAVVPRTGVPQSLVLELSEPLCLKYGCTLSLELSQLYPHHSLGHFRLSATAQPGPLRAVPESLSPVLAKAAAERTPDESNQLRKFYGTLDPAAHQKAKVLADLEKKLAAIKPVQTPVMRERPAKDRRQTKLMVKGNYLVTDQTVTAGVPAAFPPIDAKSGEPDRLGLAKWLVSRENPLTARVMVNRLWSQLFGRGLVLTEEDFGTQGTYPTHPELLDWLAVEFMDSGWDVKRLLKLMVASATYQQSSQITPERLEKDPENLLLSRGPRFRLEAETVRDQALALSGLLSTKMFGPSVYPPQPDGIWRAAFNGERTYPTSTGEDRYRRGLYVFLRRTAPNPSMATFDAPNRELCTMRRIRTNTPLQAFVTLNDPAYVEMAQALARRLAAEGGTTPEERLRFGLRLCLLHDPPSDKLETLLSLYRKELATYQSQPAEAKQLAQDPLHPLPDDTNWPEQAALTVIGNVLLNLDAVLMKG